MGELVDRVGIRMLVHGDGLADNFKNNSIFFYNKYSKSDSKVSSIGVGEIQIGRFYHLHYQDDSNWMKWSPVFIASYKKFSNQIVFFAVNFDI